ncbi:DNA-binding protein HU, partial [termite gut metagenome]
MTDKLNIPDLIDALAQKHSMNKKDATAFVKEVFLLIEHALDKDEIVKLKGLGTFKIIKVDTRESVNVNTGERFVIQGHSKITF